MLMHRSPRLCRIRSSRSETPASVHVVNVAMATTSKVRKEAPTNQSPAAGTEHSNPYLDTRHCLCCAARKALRSSIGLGATPRLDIALVRACVHILTGRTVIPWPRAHGLELIGAVEPVSVVSTFLML